MNFLPDDYESPKTNAGYMKLQDGENRIRILSKPIIGWEDWDNKKPMRFKMDNKPSKSFDPKKPVRHFWSVIVFNYAEEQIQILQISQATIRKSLEALVKDTDWGAPYFYDLKINKTGEGTETKFTVNPVPHKPVDEYIIAMFQDKPINLEALFDNGDPFATDSVHRTGLGFEVAKKAPIEKKRVTQKEASEIKSLFDQCGESQVKELMDKLKKMNPPINSIEEIPSTLFNVVKDKAMEKINEHKQSKDIMEVPF